MSAAIFKFLMFKLDSNWQTLTMTHRIVSQTFTGLQTVRYQQCLLAWIKLICCVFYRPSFIAGVIHNERVPSFERMIWRVCQGNAYLRVVPCEEELQEVGTVSHLKSLWVSVFYRTNGTKCISSIQFYILYVFFCELYGASWTAES